MMEFLYPHLAIFFFSLYVRKTQFLTHATGSFEEIQFFRTRTIQEDISRVSTICYYPQVMFTKCSYHVFVYLFPSRKYILSRIGTINKFSNSYRFCLLTYFWLEVLGVFRHNYYYVGTWICMWKYFNNLNGIRWDYLD